MKGHAGKNVNQELQEIQTCQESIEPVIKQEDVQNLLSKNLRHPYFNRSKIEPHLLSILKTLVPNPTDYIDTFLKYAAYPEKINLLKYIKDNNIPFFGIDHGTQSERLGLFKATYSSSQSAFENKENTRLQAMTSNILLHAEAESKKAQSTIIIVSVGALHAHRLATYLRFHYQTRISNLARFELDIIAGRITSPYVQDYPFEFFQSFDQKQLQEASESILYLYKTIPFHHWQCEEQDPALPRFYSAELSAICNQLVSRTYHIKDWNQQKHEYIDKLAGKALNIDGDGNTTIQIRPSLLKKEQRDILGLQSYRLTFTYDSESRVEYLYNHIPHVTIIPEQSTHLVTCHDIPSYKEIISNVSHDETWLNIIKTASPPSLK